MTRQVHHIVNEQLARWRLERQRAESGTHRERRRPKVVAFANAFRSNGSAIAAKVGQMLEMPVYDQEILKHIATTAKVHVETVETLDLHVQNWIDEYLTMLVRERNFDRSDYLRLLSRTVLALCEHGPCVLAGHGSAFVAPRNRALIVRTMAPESLRIERLATAEKVDLQSARRMVHRIDAEREAFHRRFFGVRIEDAQHYDLVLNTAELDGDSAAAVVVEAFRRKWTPLHEQRAAQAQAFA